MNSTDKILFQCVADDYVRAMLNREPLQPHFPVKCEAKVWTAVATGEVSLIVSTRPVWPQPIKIADIRRLVGRNASGFVWEPVTAADSPEDKAARLYEILRPGIESVRAYRYSDLWC